MLLPTIKIENQEDLGKAVDLLVAHIKTTLNPRKERDLVFVLATVTRLANISLQMAAHGAGSGEAAAAIGDAFVRKTAKDAAKALGYAMKDKIKS